MSFNGLVIVCTVAFLAPLLLGLVPKFRLPAIVLEILAGIAIGPAGFGWVTMDEPVRVLSVIGLAFLLFLSGLDLEVKLLRGPRLTLSLVGFAISIALGLAIGGVFQSMGIVQSALLFTVVFAASAIGLVVPVLRDVGEIDTDFGQLVIAGVSMSDFGTVLMQSLLFTRESENPVTKIVLMAGFGVLTIIVIVAMTTAGKSTRLGDTMLRLQDSTAQIRVRGAFLLLVGFVALAGRLGLEVILGAFVAGSLLAVLDPNYKLTHPKFHEKLDAVGFGVFVPVFFVSSGVQFDVGGLFADTTSLLRVPLFLVALFVIRGLPAVLYRRSIGSSRVLVAALLQATSLPFIVASTHIGLELHLVTPTTGSAFIAAGLLSVVVFPITALALLRRAPQPAPAATRGA